jgi:hypothetical protein
MTVNTEPPVWIVSVTHTTGPYQVRAAGPFSSFDAADRFRSQSIEGLAPEEAEKYAVVALESVNHPGSFASSNQ